MKLSTPPAASGLLGLVKSKPMPAGSAPTGLVITERLLASKPEEPLTIVKGPRLGLFGTTAVGGTTPARTRSLTGVDRVLTSS